MLSKRIAYSISDLSVIRKIFHKHIISQITKYFREHGLRLNKEDFIGDQHSLSLQETMDAFGITLGPFTESYYAKSEFIDGSFFCALGGKIEVELFDYLDTLMITALVEGEFVKARLYEECQIMFEFFLGSRVHIVQNDLAEFFYSLTTNCSDDFSEHVINAYELKVQIESELHALRNKLSNKQSEISQTESNYRTNETLLQLLDTLTEAEIAKFFKTIEYPSGKIINGEVQYFTPLQFAQYIITLKKSPTIIDELLDEWNQISRKVAEKYFELTQAQPPIVLEINEKAGKYVDYNRTLEQDLEDWKSGHATQLEFMCRDMNEKIISYELSIPSFSIEEIWIAETAKKMIHTDPISGFDNACEYLCMTKDELKAKLLDYNTKFIDYLREISFNDSYQRKQVFDQLSRISSFPELIKKIILSLKSDNDSISLVAELTQLIEAAGNIGNNDENYFELGLNIENEVNNVTSHIGDDLEFTNACNILFSFLEEALVSNGLESENVLQILVNQWYQRLESRPRFIEFLVALKTAEMKKQFEVIDKQRKPEFERELARY